jgi:hypothetical protein
LDSQQVDRMTIGKWDLAASLGDVRLSALAEPPSFNSIVHAIRADMQVLCCHPESCDVAIGFERIIYCIKIGQPLFDLFFNSKAGYRAAFFQSPYDGQRANTAVIAMLTPALISSSATQAQRPLVFIEESLSSSSAKVWLAEPENGFCAKCSGEWEIPKDDDAEIFNGRWECDPHRNAVNGRKAPYFTKLRIFGAFLNARYDEVVPARKRHRASHLHQWGWA